MRFSFAGQENAEGPLLEHHFGLELERVGVVPGRGWVIPSLAWRGAPLERLRVGIDRAVARMRCLLIEHNSWMCGEVPFVFPGADPAVAERGLAFYRFPKLAAVELLPKGESFTIRFAGGPLGEVTSSGFYLPTLFTGDFDLRCEYRVHAWAPGPDSACFGLFAQNLASSHRYYAQRMSDGSRPDAHRVLGSMANVIHPAREAGARAGALRVTRVGRTLTTWHREPGDEEWRVLAVDAAATADDVVFGAKVWAKLECGPIEVEVRAFEIEATMAPVQIPRLKHRPDPRRGRG
jgi:hypothetical protein